MYYLWTRIRDFVLDSWKKALFIAVLSALLIVPPAVLHKEIAFVYFDDTLRCGFFAETPTAEQAAEAVSARLSGLDYAETLAQREGYSVHRVGRGYTAKLSICGVVGEIQVNDSLTAGELLSLYGVTLGENDRMSHDEGDYISEGETLFIDRVETISRTEREVVPFEIVNAPTTLLKEGDTRHAETGADGLADRTYEDVYVNGVLESTTLISENIITAPKSDITLVGTPGAVASTIDINNPIIPDGLEIVNFAPTQYQTLIEGANCTAYTSSFINAYGAGGIGLVQGCVAVDPAVIPYGSLLYITSDDGRYVYGFAIAADTGTAMLGGYTDIDCYFETYRESALFGRKYLNVYVITQLTQDDLASYCSVTTSGAALFRSRIPK